MMPARRQPDKPAAASNKLCSIRTLNFGYKAHIGVDRESGLIHTVEATPGNVHNVLQTLLLLSGGKEVVYGDSGYLGDGKREDAIVRNQSGCKIKYNINRCPSQLKKLSKSGQYTTKKVGNTKSFVRAKVEYVFGVVKKTTAVSENTIPRI